MDVWELLIVCLAVFVLASGVRIFGDQILLLLDKMWGVKLRRK